MLVARMEGFLTRCAELDPAETLALVDKFFAWVAASALRDRCGIVERCVGDELTVLFARGPSKRGRPPERVDWWERGNPERRR